MLQRTMSLIRPALAGRFHAELLFRPRSVAVLGTGTPLGALVTRNLLGAGFGGAVLPVGGGQQAISGVLAYPDAASLPVVPDLCVLACPAPEVPAALQALGARGALAAVVLNPVPDLAAAAQAAGVRVLGPASFGIAVPGLGLNATSSHLQPRPGKVALVSQSAALCRSVLDWAEPNGVGFSHIVGIGGNADIGFGLVLDWLSRDPGTSAILLDIREIKDRRGFMSAARAAARLRPVVCIRPGGRLADPSGRADAVFEAALRRAGILRVTELEELLVAAETLAHTRPARGDAVAIVTNAIGPGRMAADAALAADVPLAAFSPETVAALRALLPQVQVEDGGVYVGADSPARVAEAASALSAAREVGGVVAVLAPTGPADAAGVEALAAAFKTAKVPLLACVPGETTGAAHRRRLAEAKVPAFAGPEQAMRGFADLVGQRRARAAARELPPRTVLSLAPDRAEVRRIFAAVRREGRTGLIQDEALAVLCAYGLPVAPGRAVMTQEDAAAAAALLGFPAVVKLRRSARPRVRGPGAVALDLHDEAEVRRAAASLAARRARMLDGPDAGALAEGFLVQRQAGRSRELRVRVQDDPVFGPAIGFGQGGSAADLLGDVAVELPPLNLALAHGLIGRTRAARTLAEFHDQPAADRDAVADALVRVSQLLVDFPEIAELDVNPLFADADGVLAADAWLALRPEGEAARFAIAPYPADLAEHWQAGDETLLIRPIRPEDAEAHAALFSRLTPQDIRFRFFSTLRELSPEQVARLTQVDYDREMAFVAVREATGETVGVSRLVQEAYGTTGEFAVLVEPSAKGRGLATKLMHKLFDWARARGMTRITGQVLAENAPMLAFVRRLGFRVRRTPDEPDVMEAELPLDEGAARAA